MLADPVDEPAGLRVGLVAGPLGDRLHPVKQLLLPPPQLRVLLAGTRRRRGFRGHGDRLDLDFFLGLDEIGLLFAPLVVGRGRREEEVVCLVVRRRGRFPFAPPSRGSGRIGLLPGGVVRLLLLPVAFDGPPMDRQTARERLDRRQQPLLEADDEQAGCRLGLAGGVGVALLAGGAVFVEQARQLQLGRVRRQPVDDDAFDAPLRKAALRRADVLLQAPDHHVLKCLAPPHLHAAGEPVGIEQFQQRREAVRMPVVRRGRQEEPMLEARREITDGPRELRLDAVAPAARRCRVMRLVEDEQAPRPHRAEPGPHRIGVARIDQQVVRHEEPAVGHPRIHPEAALATHPTQVGAVEDLEHQTEAILQLALPLLQHRRRRGDDDRLRLPAQQQLPGDEPRLDGLAEPGVVGDEQIDPRQP